MHAYVLLLRCCHPEAHKLTPRCCSLHVCVRGCARWRKLEGADPATYEMVQKIQTLQRRLIIKSEEVVEKDLVIQVRAGRNLCVVLCVVAALWLWPHQLHACAFAARLTCCT